MLCFSAKGNCCLQMVNVRISLVVPAVPTNSKTVAVLEMPPLCARTLIAGSGFRALFRARGAEQVLMKSPDSMFQGCPSQPRSCEIRCSSYRSARAFEQRRNTAAIERSAGLASHARHSSDAVDTKYLARVRVLEYSQRRRARYPIKFCIPAMAIRRWPSGSY